ncbi:unnamed protein product [Vicia faba]|uniref:Uncharacterized protein n=1 Tax=Vicia faba TaxID=3906 RepID=A0AAV1B1F1_VICFA|nr:unnamed protein product [Vicia faba]
MVTTRSNPENPNTMERILEMLTADRQNREVERQQFETRFARLEAMVENLSKHSEDGTPKGMEWLASLGEISANFEQLTLGFKINGRKVILKGEPQLSKKDASLNSMLKALQQGEGFFIDYRHIQAEIDWKDLIPSELKDVLHDFPSIFEPPDGLPPHRRQDHAIHLKEGAQIPNIIPYRYPHYQKQKLKNWLQKC